MPYREDLIKDSGPAYAGYGFGLCSDYKDTHACIAEPIATEYVLLILYIRTALMVSLTYRHGAYIALDESHYRIADFTLGFDNRNEDPDSYGREIRSSIQYVLRANTYSEENLGKVLLLGESVHDTTFRRILMETLETTTGGTPVLHEGAVSVASRGAAEFAKRAYYDPANSRVTHEEAERAGGGEMVLMQDGADARWC